MVIFPHQEVQRFNESPAKPTVINKRKKIPSENDSSP